MRTQCSHREDQDRYQGLERGGVVELAHLHLILLKPCELLLPYSGGSGLAHEVGADVLACSGEVCPETVRPPRIEPVGLRFDVQDLTIVATTFGFLIAHAGKDLICRCRPRNIFRGSVVSTSLSGLTSQGIDFGDADILVFDFDFSPQGPSGIAERNQFVVVSSFHFIVFG